MGTTDPSCTLSQASAVEVRSHPDCGLHQPPPGHPEAPDRLRDVLEALSDPPADSWKVVPKAELPKQEEVLGALRWIHAPAYIERVREAAAAGTRTLDSDDCVLSAGSWEAALSAAGLALQAALDMANSRLWRGFLACRPPGKHAERDRARGYCFFNNVALAAEVLVRSWNAPVLVVNFGSHHANGLQSMFYDRADVGLVSVHAYPAFPGTGTADEVGEGAGRGTTRNIPLAAGSDDQVVSGALAAAVEELGTRMRPEAILVCAGFDGHASDPVGAFKLSTAGFAAMTRTVVEASEAWAGGRLLSILEGGFQCKALRDSARIHVNELAQIGAAH